MSRIFQLPKQVPIDGGVVVPGAKANFHLTGTTTDTNTYTDSALTTPHANPVVADAAGVFATIYLDPDIVYALTLTDSADALIYTEDPIQDALTAANIGQIVFPRTAAEISAGVTPTNFQYEMGDSRRYGALFDGSTDDSTAHQDALDVLEQAEGGTWRIADGTSRAQGLICRAESIRIICGGWLQPVSNAAPASVLQMGVDTTDLVREITGNINIGGLSQVASSWTNITGLDCKLMNECQLFISVRGVNKGIAGTSGSGGFVAYNHFFLGAMVNNKIDISLDPTGTGAVNENKFYGGRFTENSGTWAAGRINIEIDDDGDNQVNHNVFYSPSFEGDGRIVDWVGALDNHIINARYEPGISGTADVDYDAIQLLMDSTCARNHIHIGGGASWFQNSVDHGAGTRVNDASFTIASTDVTNWFYPGAPMLLTIGGKVLLTYCRSSTFSTNTTVNVFLPNVTGNPTVIATARFQSSGDDNKISHNTLALTAVDTFSFESNPRSIIDYGRSMLNISAINDDYPAINMVAGGSGDNKCWQVVNLTGSVSGYMDGNGYEYATRLSMGDATTPQATFAAIADASGGSVIDIEARAALNTLLAKLRLFGLIST